MNTKETVRLLCEAAGQIMTTIPRMGDPNNIDLMHLRGARDQLSAVIEALESRRLSPQERLMSLQTYTYTIFDANPHSSSGTAWPTHQDVEIQAESDEGAIEVASDVMSTEAAGLNSEDGYDAGQLLYALVWNDEETIVGEPTYEVTAEDLGLETKAERLARAAKHIDATDLGDGRWAHYATETGRYYVVSADELAELCDYLDDEDEQISRDAYSHWCAGTSSEEMPEGWEPEGEQEP